MANINIDGLSAKELQDLITSAQHQIVSTSKQRLADTREKIHAILRAEGFALDEVFPTRGGKSKGLKGSSVAAKYAHPSDPSKTWTGRGKRPHWFVEALAKGASEASLSISAPAAKATPKAKAAPATKVAAKKPAAKKAVKKAVKK